VELLELFVKQLSGTFGDGGAALIYVHHEVGR
jgi:hypothetical protein